MHFYNSRYDSYNISLKNRIFLKLFQEEILMRYVQTNIGLALQRYTMESLILAQDER